MEVEAIVIVIEHETMQLKNFEGLSHMKKLRLLMISGFVPERDQFNGLDFHMSIQDYETLQLKNFEGLLYMEKLRLFMMRDRRELKYLSNDLRFLTWNGFRYERFPSSFRPLKLVQLIVWRSNIEHLWNNCVKVTFLFQYWTHTNTLIYRIISKCGFEYERFD